MRHSTMEVERLWFGGISKISLPEVEACLREHPRIAYCRAFAAEHKSQKSVVGLALIPEDCDEVYENGQHGLRPGLSELQSWCAEKLLPAFAWPEVIVYLEEGETTDTSIIQVHLSDDESIVARHYECIQGVCRKVRIDAALIAEAAREVCEDCAVMRKEDELTLFFSPGYTSESARALENHLRHRVHGYEVPRIIIAVAAPTLPRTQDDLDFTRIDALAQFPIDTTSSSSGPRLTIDDQTTTTDNDEDDSIDDDYSSLGETEPSKKYLAIDRLDDYSYQDKYPSSPRNYSQTSNGISFVKIITCASCSRYGHSSRPSSTRCFVLLIQLLPLFVIAPLIALAELALVAYMWMKIGNAAAAAAVSTNANDDGRASFWKTLIALGLAILIARFFMSVFRPLLGLILKYLILGKQAKRQESGHAMSCWSSAYLRWWFVDTMLSILGRGILRQNLPLYAWLMGADVGPQCRIDKKCVLAEFDLLQIGARCALDAETIVRGMSLERDGYLCMDRVTIGDDCSLGAKSVLAPGAKVSNDVHLGPNSSNHELDDSRQHYRGYCRTLQPVPSLWSRIFFGVPILIFVYAFALIPVAMSLAGLIHELRKYDPSTTELRTRLVETGVRGAAYFVAGQVAYATVSPFLYLLATVFIARCLLSLFIATTSPSYDNNSHKKPLVGGLQQSHNLIFKSWLMNELVDDSQLVRIALRLGGAPVTMLYYKYLGLQLGKRIQWPDTGLVRVCAVDYDLVSIGDDARIEADAVLMASDAYQRLPLHVGAGASVATDAVLLPGASLERCTALGPGGLAAAGSRLPAHSAWIGSRGGSAVRMDPDDDITTQKQISAYGQAHYWRELKDMSTSISSSDEKYPRGFDPLYKPPYRVYYDYEPILLRIGVAALQTSIFGVLPFLSLAAARDESIAAVAATYCLYIALASAASLALVVEVHRFIFLNSSTAFLINKMFSSKKKSVTANNDDDEELYSARPQQYRLFRSLLAVLVKPCAHFGLHHADDELMLKDGLLSLIHGSVFSVYFHRALGADIGIDVCLTPSALGTSSFIEIPERVHLEDRVSVFDCASLDTSSRGLENNYSTHITLRTGATTKAKTRLLAGTVLGSQSVLLEHTIVLAQEHIDSDTTVQGAPARFFMHSDDNDLAPGTPPRLFV